MTTRKREDEETRTTKKLKTSPKQATSVLDSIANDIAKDAKLRAQANPVLLKKPDPLYIDCLSDIMLSVPLLENHLSHNDDEETRQTLNPKGTPDGGPRIELEVRLGDVRDNNQFVPGIKKADFEAYSLALKSDPDAKYEHTQQKLYYYEISEGGNIRVEYDEKSQQCISSEYKQRLGTNTDLELSFLPYSCRLSVSSEENRTAPTSLPDSWKFCRERNRWCYTKSEWSWKIDLTEVITTVPDESEKPRINYEMEIEFDDEVIQTCRNADKVALKAIATRFWDFITKVLNLLYKGNESHFDKTLSLQKITEDSQLRDMRETCCAWIGQADNYRDFPGSMPVNFSKKSIPTILQQENYHVSEKTDGIRCMLMIDPTGVHMIDRKFDFYRLEGFDSLVTVFASKGLTLLDGEMVTHIPSKKQMYLIFDIVALNGVVVTTKTLKERLITIGTGVVKIYRDSIDSKIIPEDHPFTLIGKQFLPIGDLYKLLAFIKTVNGQKYYIDEKRHHRTDGFIFTPNGAYHPKTCNTLFKWKYLEELSIDLKAHFARLTQSISWSCVGDRGEDSAYDIKMRNEDSSRLTRYLSVQKDPNLIIEVCFDVKTGLWKFKCIRTDKAKANHIRVVNNTVDVIQENITEKDLLKFFPKKSPPPSHPNPKAQPKH